MSALRRTTVGLCAVGLAGLVWGCGWIGASGPLELTAPFTIGRLADDWAARGRTTGFEARLRVRDGDGQTVPFALVQLDWADGGRTAFQADDRGELWIRFPAPEDLSGITVSLRSVELGAEFVVAGYDEFSRAIDGGSVRVTLDEYVPLDPGT